MLRVTYNKMEKLHFQVSKAVNMSVVMNFHIRILLILFQIGLT